VARLWGQCELREGSRSFLRGKNSDRAPGFQVPARRRGALHALGVARVLFPADDFKLERCMGGQPPHTERRHHRATA
jgi:hypothetical protein